ncbi:MAG: zinc ribbon domain-containing protein [Myxococcales bacterium]
MPIYEYACAACAHTFEEWQKMSDPPVKTCPKCKKKKVEKLISHTAFQLKGGGWYKDLYSSSKPGASSGGSGTDAGGSGSSDGGGGAKTGEKTGDSSSGAAAGKSEGKSEGKSDGKSDGKSSSKGDVKDAKKKDSPKKSETRAA